MNIFIYRTKTDASGGASDKQANKKRCLINYT